MSSLWSLDMALIESDSYYDGCIWVSLNASPSNEFRSFYYFFKFVLKVWQLWFYFYISFLIYTRIVLSYVHLIIVCLKHLSILVS